MQADGVQYIAGLKATGSDVIKRDRYAPREKGPYREEETVQTGASNQGNTIKRAQESMM